MKIRLRITIFTLILFSAPNLTFAKDYVISPPPPSLNKFYPPESKTPRWIEQMHKISGAFGGVFVDMKESDWKNAEEGGQRFLEAYTEASKWVPEWKDYFDLKAAQEFSDSVISHDPKQIRKASGPVAKTCSKCHSNNYLPVWAKYHMPSVKKIKVVDPIGDKELDYRAYMYKLSSNFKEITVNFSQEQYTSVFQSINNFQKRIKELRSVCSKCHVSEWSRSAVSVRQFFVNNNILEILQDMKKELATGEPNPKKFWKSVETIRIQSCKKCHLVHQSYTLIRHAWDQPE
jgi:hypothetical protein